MLNRLSHLLDSFFAVLTSHGIGDGVARFLVFQGVILGLTYLVEVRILQSPGVSLSSQIRIVPIVSTPFILLVMAAAQRQQKLMQELAGQARTDQLTGLPNRRAFMERLENAQHSKAGLPGLLAILDLDDFKRVNDFLGHEQGDLCLQRFATLMRAVCCDDESFCRLGGEEFALFIPAQDITRARLHSAALCAGFTFAGLERPLTVSAGFTWFKPGENIKDAMRRADDALYEAKHNGKACAYLRSSKTKQNCTGEELFRTA